VHYGPGGTSNASAYGLQNGRVRNMLRSQVALLKLHTLKVEQSLTRLCLWDLQQAGNAAGTTAGADWRVQLADYASSRLKDEEVMK
jgi:hypothetical protein